MERKALSAGIGTLFLLALFALPARAAVIDQQYEPVPMYSYGQVSGFYNYAQTFTAGVTGTLTQMDLFLSRGRYNEPPYAYDLRVDVRPVDGSGIPVYANSSALGQVIVPYTSIAYTPNTAAWYSVDFSSLAVHLDANTTYAIVLSGTVPPLDFGGTFDWYGGMNTAYPGNLFRRDVVNYDYWFAADTQSDLGFRTFVQPDVTPEPGSAMLLGSAVLALAGIRRRPARR